jgi:hypothetical protein
MINFNLRSFSSLLFLRSRNRARTKAEGSGEANLLQSIEKFSRVKLKKTETKDKSGPYLPVDTHVQLTAGLILQKKRVSGRRKRKAMCDAEVYCEFLTPFHHLRWQEEGPSKQYRGLSEE